MNEYILELAAMLLALFCLVYSYFQRRKLYAAPRGGLIEALKNQHLIYLTMLGSVIVSAATSVAAVLGQGGGAGRGALTLLNMAYFFFHNTLPFLFTLYVLNLCGPARKRRGWYFALLAVPLLLGEALLLSNPLTHICFTIDEALVYQRGAGLWTLYAVAAVYAVIGFVYFLRFGRELPRHDRVAALILIAVTFAGVAIQAVWAVPVELFFEAVAFFGFMAMLEHDDEASEAGMSRRFRGGAIIAITLIFLAVIVVNVSLILNLTASQSDQIGNIRLDAIRGDLQDTLADAETKLMRVAVEAERRMDEGQPREELSHYFNVQRESMLADESFMNVFIAGSDWHIVPGFDAPPDFHASERVWYLGAKDNPDGIFISDPYVDADTGAMCFTVSTLLLDGDTVVGMDLNFSKAQESIRRMTNGTDQTAMIVTSSGLIVGYTDMSFVGERADEKLPEYAEVLRRVASSREHDSFRVELNGRPCVVFSSQTSNDWFLILSADIEALYADSNRQMAEMVAVNLLMLVVVVIFYLIGKRNRVRTAEALAENERVIEGLAGKLRQSATQLLRLSDATTAGDGAGGSPVEAEIRDSGYELNKLADDMRAYSGLLRRQREAEGDRGRKRRAASASAPSRGVRNAIAFTLVAAMAVALVFCVRSTANWGNTRMGWEADKYENQLNGWLTQQKSILYMFTDIISSRPELLADYDEAVRWLNSIVVKYPEISACYLVNPYADPPVIMNTGWLPGKDERPETRPWYQATERAVEGFNISAPYMDAQTGDYCVTLSRVVYGANNEFLGIFGIDFFLDKLISVLGESYTSASYAFLVDSDHVIINHPNADYQMRGDASTSVEDTEYAEAYHRQGVTTLRDYSGQLFSCLCRRTDAGFSILVANRWWSIYGGIVAVALGLLLLFCVIIVVIVALINRLIRWQEGVNRQLREAMDAAVNANRAKSQFLSQMSHEIRTPMNAIIGLDNIALRDPDVAPRTREQLEKIDASARHLLSLINDILDMSRIESGRMVLREERFAFRDFLDQICVIVGGQCADKGLRFECQAAGDVDEYLVGDDLKLKQVLINILGNAVKFTDAPGRVTFIAEETDRGDDGCRLRFTMKDTGIGMDREFIPKLFEAFSQEDATTTNRYGGSGLGMAITKNIVDMMGGEISVESEKGHGSTFVVTVPLKRARQAERPADTAGAASAEEPSPAGGASLAEGASAAEGPSLAEGASLAGLHLLIAEDIELNAEVLIDLLDMEGVTCEWAENGERAVAVFGQSAENHFDAVLMDMRMPVMDGLAATRAIRRLDRPDAKAVPIIALTANAFEEDSRRCLEAGMNAHLSKPVDIELLKKTLDRLLGAASKQRLAES